MPTNHACTEFLQWMLPQLQMRWKGYKKVRGQVCKRIRRRMNELGIREHEDYKAFIIDHPSEWELLDRMCEITISRFYRDKRMWETLETEIIPELLKKCISENRNLKVWCIGSASGEEPYTMSILWQQVFAKEYPEVNCNIRVLEINPDMINRALKGCYFKGSIRDIPPDWKVEAFSMNEGLYCIKKRYKSNVVFEEGDMRKITLTDKYDLIFCRNLVAMYYNEELQVRLFSKITSHLEDDGFLVLGNHEIVPDEIGLQRINKWFYQL